jgi:hypothetical protein
MARYLLYPIISHNSPISLSNKTFVYKTYLRPIITYASPIWASKISNPIITNSKSSRAPLCVQSLISRGLYPTKRSATQPKSSLSLNKSPSKVTN